MMLKELQVGDDQFARLNQSSIELVSAFTEACMQPDMPWRAALAQGLARCAQAADQLGMRGLNYVATLLVPHLKQASGQRANGDAELLHAEVFCNQLMMFCVGVSTPEQSHELAASLQKWPNISPIPDQFVAMIRDRLSSDAEMHRAVVATVEPVKAEPAPPAAATVLPQLPYLNVDNVVAPSTAVVAAADVIALAADFTVASDELAMLAEACADLADEVTPSLLSLPLLEPTDESSLWVAVFSEYKERIEYFANAASFIGLQPLELWLSRLAENLGVLVATPTLMSEELRGLLMLVPENLRAYFEAPSESSAEQAIMLLEDSAWPQPQEGVVLLATVGALAQLSLISSRQVIERSDDVSEDDVSLRIPQDADVNVVENLLRELPQLSSEFSEAIESIAKGSFEDIEPAQRIAHTLKGSANTVGVRGIANLTHQLEDILQLLSAEKKLPPQILMDHLSDAADCLAEMSEAVAGMGEPPEQALEVYRASVTWTNRLVREGVPSDDLVSEVRAERANAAAELDSSVELTDVEEVVEVAQSAEGAAAPAAEATGDQTGEAANRDDQMLRVPASLIDRMLGFTGEAAILLAQVQDRLALLEKTRGTIKVDTDRLTSLSDELDHLVDIRGLSMNERKEDSSFDALELDEYNELHTVARRIAESGADAKLVDQQLDRDLSALKDMVAQLERVQTDLRESTLQSHMVQISTVAPRLQRAARQAGRMAGKLVDFNVHGGDTAMDSHLLQTLIDPLTHMIRNAVDHGIETDALRSRSGKALNGQISLTFERAGRNLRIHCRDDGGGLNMEAIRKRGIERGFIQPDGVYPDHDLARLILQPGFSTRDTATQLSGRGVGMDVVYQAVRQLRGNLDIEHTPGQGTHFTITLPVRMAAVPIIVARSGQHVIGISVRGVEQILPRMDSRVSVTNKNILEFDGQQVPIIRLEELLDLPINTFARTNAPEALLLIRQEDKQLKAVISPELSQTRNVIVRPMSKYLPKAPGIEGAAVLGDGSVASVVDLPELISSQEEYTAGNIRDGVVTTAPVMLKPAPVCLVVDDSVSVRRSMEYFVRDLGFEVDSASDGIDALGRLQHRKPDIMIVDFEMPRMNGVELTAAVRNDPRTVNVPVIMITSRYTEKHKQMAMNAGVNVFLTKPYTEDDLATQIERCLQNIPS
jgi:chemotaxis protein histidine kinase CheA/ActR/RegA family two-component response regulator